jgi:uncharacterized protein YdaU (DUF1376 family)
MSFAYMPFYTGDYYRDTRHLSMLQHGAYRQLLDHCWDQRGPLPLDLERCYRICGATSKEEQEAVRGVIAEFFVSMDDGHYNKRIQEELERANVISSKRAEAAHERWRARASIKAIDALRDASAVHVHSKSNASAPSLSLSPSPSLSLTPSSPQETKPSRASRVALSAPVGVDLQDWQDWLRNRKEKHLALTPAAMALVQREADKAKLTLGQAIRVAAENGWGGFKAKWLEGGGNPLSAAEQAMKMIEEREREKN